MIKGIIVGVIIAFVLFMTWCLCRAASDADEAMGLKDENIWKEED